jgi:hypothetical protein
MLALTTQIVAQAPTPTPPCAWPEVVHAPGTRNVAFPDTNSTYWVMPFDSALWPEGSKMIIRGQYTKSRFFSFTVYGGVGEVFDTINDSQITPDPGSENPFAPPGAGPGSHTYTLTLERAPVANPEDYALAAPQTNGRIIYRVYVPNEGLDLKGGVPLPTITMVYANGNTQTLGECDLDPVTMVARPTTQEPAPIPGQPLCEQDPARPDVLCFAPADFGFLFPNPAVHYIASNALDYRPDKIIVVRARAANFPNTFKGGSIFDEALPNGGPLQMRYWSMCNNEITTGWPVVACQADFSTKLDGGNFFTYVISHEDSGSRPSWLPRTATWIPWGRTNLDNLLIFRSMLAPEDFPAEDSQFYPKAVYCDKRVFKNQGWRGCFKDAGVK